MSRGGKRPGAGAPKGNLNALRHGRDSAQMRALLVLFSNPAFVRLAGRLMQAQAHRNARERKYAAVAAWLRRLRPQDIALSPDLPALRDRQVHALGRSLTDIATAKQSKIAAQKPPR